MKNIIKRTAIATALLGCASLGMAAEAELRGSEFLIHTDTNHAGGILKVSGSDGFYYEEKIKPGSTPAIDINALKDFGMADGTFRYEVTLNPISDLSSQDLKDLRDIQDETVLAELRKDGILPNAIAPISGTLSVAAGAPVDPSIEEIVKSTGTTPAAPIGLKDQVINDDLIVTFSICVGQDCSNGESFGFDTLKLKENNLRIKFDDTSNSASFPNNDWQLTANDSTNGGANKFSIDDISGGRTPFTIEASAPSNSLYVDDGGRVGLGTAAPVVELHVVNGDSPTMRLEQNGSSGFQSQTWDVAGNETNFFVRDATNGSRLPFKIKPSAPTNSLYVDTNGDIGFRTQNPDASLHIIGESAADAEILLQTADNNSKWLIRANDSTDDFIIGDAISGKNPFKIVDGANSNMIFLGKSGVNDAMEINANLDVNGTISINGTQVHPDYVFEEEYKLLSIEEHSEIMWKNKSLPKVGPGTYREDGTPYIDLVQRSQGMLEEVEIAHRYIEILNKELNSLKGVNDELKELKAMNQQLMQRLEALESDG